LVLSTIQADASGTTWRRRLLRLAITLSLFFALSVSLPAMGNYQVLLVAVALLATIGFLDDRGECFSAYQAGGSG